MKEKKLIFFSQIFIVAVISIIAIMTAAKIQPLFPIKKILKELFPLFFTTAILVFLTFKIVSYYYTQLHTYASELKSLYSSVINLSGNLKMENLSQNVLNELMKFYNGGKGVLFLNDERLKKYVSIDTFSINTGKYKKDKKVSQYTWNIFNPAKVDKNTEERIKKILNEYQFNCFPSVIIIPFCKGNETKAVGIIGTEITNRKVLEKKKETVEIFVRQATAFFENALLHEEVNEASITDPLTNLYNRRYFQKRMKEEFAKSKRVGFPISLMISDLDNFKHYVDTYGHHKGDIILHEVASLIKKSLRESDIICRFGGDEFAYLLPYTTSLEAKTIAERIKNKVSKHKFLKEDGPVYITLSIGIASFPEHGNNAEEILQKADAALFYAKEKGRDKIVVFGKKE